MDRVAIVVLTAGIVAFAALIIEAHGKARPRLRALLSLSASAALIYLLTGRPLALILFTINILLVLGTWRLSWTRFWWGWILVLILLLVVSKLPMGIQSGTNPGDPFRLGTALWIGFSYFVFRLIHVTVDAHAGRVGQVSLEEMLVYALHPASLMAGPIDRVRNSVSAQQDRTSTSEELHQGLWRILRGSFVKFAVANPLFAFIAVHDMVQNPDRPTGIAWLWLFAYSFYLFADFASYSDLAIGFGRLAGLHLPENFEQPYLSSSIALFWQRWHMSLSFWLRDYIFFPLARALRAKAGNRHRAAIQLICHLTTMGAAGLWHGLTGGFLLWGLWHGVGLFLNGQFGGQPARRGQPMAMHTRIRTVLSVMGTFLFVTLGWVFFASDLPTAVRIFARLFGIQ